MLQQSIIQPLDRFSFYVIQTARGILGRLGLRITVKGTRQTSPPLSQYPARGYHNWGRPLPTQPQALWARRSSWNSLGGCRPFASSSPSASPAFTPTSARPFYGYGLGGLGGVVGGSLRIRGPRASSSPHRHFHHVHQDEEESLLSPPAAAPHSLHLPHPVRPGYFVPRRDRRALSLELPHLLQVPGPPHPPPPPHLPPPPPPPSTAFHAHHRKKSFSGAMVLGGGDGLGVYGGVHQDCNGKTPLSQHLQLPPRHHTETSGGPNPHSQLMADVFPQVNTRSKDREDLDDDIEYVSYRYNGCGRELSGNSGRKKAR